MGVLTRLCEFTSALDRLLTVPDPMRFEREWTETDVQRIGWEALALARRADTESLEPVLTVLDRRLLAVLERCRTFLDTHLVTFRIPELERWQHAAAAALVGARWGVAGLRAVIDDRAAPLARRYFAFLALGERHPSGAWPLFHKYLTTPEAHHAFLAAAVEAARYYPGAVPPPVRDLIDLFERIRGDQLQRRFLSPKLLESLYVLSDPAALPLFEQLLVAGHTDRDAERCEVTLALVAVRKLTGRIASSSKFPDPDRPEVVQALDAAARVIEDARDQLFPVTVI